MPDAPAKPRFFDDMRAALPAAHQVTMEQAFLDGRMTQAEVDLAAKDPVAQRVAAAIDTVRAAIDTAAADFNALPEPWRTWLNEARAAVDTADDALSHIGL